MHFIMKILTDKNVFRKDLLFNITCWDFLSIFQQNSLSQPCLAYQAMQKQEWLNEAVKSVPPHWAMKLGFGPDIVQPSVWLCAQACEPPFPSVKQRLHDMTQE